EMLQTVAQELEHLGRDWEAAAWYRALLGFRAPPPWAEPEFTRLAAQLISIPALTRPEVCPTSQFDYSTFPLPEFAEASSSRRSAAESPVDPSPIRFENVAASAGIDFTFYNGYDPQAGRAYMFEFNGGGVAVLDYDHDGWPDLYFTQGARWPIRPADTTYRDRLYRNLGNGQFADVTDAAGLGDTGYSCGAAVGDLDNDGWPDLYVGNIGPNRLYRNRGDGTFEDVTEASGTAGDQWTSSAVLADLNDDGLPDLYVTNYLAGPEVYEQVCVDQGRPVQCGPTLFRGEQDRLYVNLGDGRFADATETSGIVVPDGKGLGVLVADFDHSGKLGIFVANDTTANFFFRNVGGPAGRPPVFREDAMLSGVAFDEHGKAQACMGIAAGDADGDGRLDMFVTNFYREPNALYVQQPDGGFIDQIRPAGMYEASFWTMGWGTQFLDADHDGWLDLILVNGHVNDFRSGGTPYQMPAQGFRNLGGGKFAELPASNLGPYFSQPYLGRALAVLDWNRDGRDDCCATHIDAPPALLENRTELARHYLAVRLVGTTGERDAIGTRLELAVGNRTWYRQLTAGDGFQASNERRIVFGLGEVPPATTELRVTWRGGRQDVFKDLPLDAEVILVEGSAQGHRQSSAAASTVRP
ncbi:MAG: CRTAC1 family protein, partial [Pirellulales bacterium]